MILALKPTKNNPKGMTWIYVKSCHPFGIYKTIPKSIIVSRLRRFHVDYDSNSPQR